MTAVDTRRGQNRGGTGSWAARACVASLLACMIVGLTAADEPAKTKAKKAKKGDDAKTTTPAKKAPNRKSDQDESPTPGVPPRPKKVITPPTLTSVGLDALVDTFLEATKAPPATVTTDVEFVRRIYLDLNGKLPTPQQAGAFVNTREKDKRAKLIEHLLGSHEYADNWARYWRDVVKYHATNQNQGRIGFEEMEEWLTEQIAKNRPWDEVARELIAGTGSVDKNGAAAFTVAHEAQPVEIAGEVSRIFLGVQIQCAQCHDHPNDSWKRQQFHEFASFFAGAKTKRTDNISEVFDQGRPRYTMPDLKDPQRQIPVAPKFFLASADSKSLPANMTAAERHHVAADYVTAQDNPWFAKAYVNRIWYALMGDTFYMPVDDMGPQRTAKAPEVLEALATQWQQGGYDVRWLFRTILNSRAYQREIRSTYSASSKTPFASNTPSRLRADQILDELAQALNLPLDASSPMPGAAGKAAAKNSLTKDLKAAVGKTKGGGGGRGFTQRGAFNQMFGVDPSMPNDDILGTIPQALFLMNLPSLNRAIEARPGTVLGEILMATPDNRVALNALYVRVLARDPTATEVKTFGRYLEAVGNRKEAFEDLLWALVNSTEFVTRR